MVIFKIEKCNNHAYTVRSIKKGDVFSVLSCEPVKAKCSTENISPFILILRPGYRNLFVYIDLTSGISIYLARISVTSATYIV